MRLARPIALAGGAVFLDFATVWEAVADAAGDHDAVVQGDRRRATPSSTAARLGRVPRSRQRATPEGASVGLYL